MRRVGTEGRGDRTNTDDAEDDHGADVPGGPVLALGELVNSLAGDEGLDGGHCVEVEIAVKEEMLARLFHLQGGRIEQINARGGNEDWQRRNEVNWPSGAKQFCRGCEVSVKRRCGR